MKAVQYPNMNEDNNNMTNNNNLPESWNESDKDIDEVGSSPWGEDAKSFESEIIKSVPNHPISGNTKAMIWIASIAIALIIAFVGGMLAFGMFGNDGNFAGTPSNSTNMKGTIDTTYNEQTSTGTTNKSEAGSELEGQALAEEFLKQFPTIFSESKFPYWDSEEGGYRYYWHDEYGEGRSYISRETPDFYYRNGDLYDKQSNIVTGNNFLWIFDDVPSYATDFALFDFDNNGIPEIIIDYYGGDFGCASGSTMFKFIDGEYRKVVVMPRISGDDLSYRWRGGLYYFDNEGNLVSYANPEGYSSYDYIVFDGGNAKFNRIAELSWGEKRMWENYVTGASNIPENDIDLRISHNIPGSKIRITPIKPLASMKEAIIASIKGD